MWDKLRRQWPRLYEALEWVTFAMRPPNLTEAARVTASLLDQYGPARLLRVEELAPGIFRGILAGGAQALAVVREDGRIAVREAEPWV